MFLSGHIIQIGDRSLFSSDNIFLKPRDLIVMTSSVFLEIVGAQFMSLTNPVIQIK